MYMSLRDEAALELYLQYPDGVGIYCARCGCETLSYPAGNEFYRTRGGLVQWYCDECFGDIVCGPIPTEADELDRYQWATYLREFNLLTNYLHQNFIHNPLR